MESGCCPESRQLGFRDCVEWQPGHVRGQHWYREVVNVVIEVRCENCVIKQLPGPLAVELGDYPCRYSAMVSRALAQILSSSRVLILSSALG